MLHSSPRTVRLPLSLDHPVYLIQYQQKPCRREHGQSDQFQIALNGLLASSTGGYIIARRASGKDSFALTRFDSIPMSMYPTPGRYALAFQVAKNWISHDGAWDGTEGMEIDDSGGEGMMMQMGMQEAD